MKKEQTIRRKSLALLLPVLAIIGIVFAAPLGASDGVDQVPQPAEPSSAMVGIANFH